MYICIYNSYDSIYNNYMYIVNTEHKFPTWSLKRNIFRRNRTGKLLHRFILRCLMKVSVYYNKYY